MSRKGSLAHYIALLLVDLILALLPLSTGGSSHYLWIMTLMLVSLGVGIAEVSDEDVPKLGLSNPRGALVRQVMPGEPADKGGLKAMDVILSVDEEPVQGPRDLQRIIATSPPGKSVKLRLVREGKETELSVTVGLYQERAERERSGR